MTAAAATMRRAVSAVAVVAGPVFERANDDGEVGYAHYWFVEAYADGLDWAFTHPQGFRHYADADRLRERVETQGDIDPEQWGARVMYGTETWFRDGYEQRQIEDERDGLG